MQTSTRWIRLASATVAVGFLLAAGAAFAQAGGETFTATASVKTATASATRPVTIQIDRLIAAADRDKLAQLLKAGDSAGLRTALAGLPDLGYIEVGTTRTPIKYAYVRSTGSGRMVTVFGAEPILHLGGAAPNAKPKEGYDFSAAILVLDASDKGDGELMPATKLKLNESGAIVTEKYEADTIRLTGIVKKTT